MGWRTLPFACRGGTYLSTAEEECQDLVRRLAGADRYATAALLSQRANGTGTPVYIASGEEFADALGAAAGAGVVGWPVLLVPSDGPVPDAVRDELERLTPRLVLLGGDAALAPAVELEPRWRAGLTRLEGASDVYVCPAPR